MSKSRVIIHTPIISSYSGGAKFIIEITKRLTLKAKVCLIIKSNNDSVLKAFSSSSATFFPSARIFSRSFLYWLTFPVSFIFEVTVTALNVKQSDILLSFLFPSNLVCAIVSRVKKVTHFHYCFEPYPYLQNENFISTVPYYMKPAVKIYSILFRKVDLLSIRNAHKVFTLNEITHQLIKSVYDVESIITLMGVDSVHFAPQKSRKYQNLFHNRPIIVHSTDYTSLKNTNLAIKVVSELLKRFPNVVMLITSTRPNAPEKQGLVDMVNDLKLDNNVKFLDLIDYSDLPILYSNAVCYLSCSTDKMLGTTSSNLPVKEALACGTPALRANITTEDVVDGQSGYLINPSDTVSVADKISYLIANPKVAQKMGMAGRKRIVKEYQWQKVAEIIANEIGDNS